MAVGLHEFSELTSLIYGAAFDEDKWDVFLKRLSRVAGDIHTQMFGYDFDTGTDLGVRQTGYGPDFMRTYHDYYCGKNAWAEGMLASEIGVPQFSQSLCSLDDLYRTEWYNDWIRPQEDILGGGGVLLFKEDRRMLVLGGNIRSRDVERLERPWIELMALLTPHLQQAFEIMRTTAGRALERQAVAGGPEPLAASCFAVTQGRRIVYANPAGNALLESGDLVRRDMAGHFVFPQWAHERTFAGKLAAVAASETHHPQAFEMADVVRKEIHACRIARVMPALLPYPGLGVLFGADEPVFLVTISSRRVAEASTLSELGDRYSLTVHEMKTVVRLVDGLSPREIADERSVSIHTVRNQIKSAMTKMGVRRQVEIGRMVESLRR